MKKFIYRVLENDEVVAIFNEQQYAILSLTKRQFLIRHLKLKSRYS